jgi:FdhD protein
VCGRRSIDDLLARCAPLQDESRFEPEAIARAFEALRERQALFRHTGGLHAAGIFRADGSAWAVYEDIGRHNAVDKAIGQLVLENALPASGTLLAVSGRASFEMVQKAVVAGIPVIASVSAASSLAIDLAARARATLLAFVRDGRMNIYAGEERIR